MSPPKLSLQHEREIEAFAAKTSPRRLRCYFAVLLLVPLSILLLAFPLARSHYFIVRTRQATWHAMDYHAHMGTQNCDIVIFGDSTGMADVDPLVVQAETGLKTCNLSLVYMAWAATGDTVLHRYLAENPPPRLIVFVTHARHLHAPTLDDIPGTIDGWLMVDRLSDPLSAARFFVRHPRLSFIFAAGIWQNMMTWSGPTRPDLSQNTYQQDVDFLRTHNGFLPFPRTIDKAAICAGKIDPPVYDSAFLSELRKQYSTGVTTVWLYAGPVRDCDENNSLYRSATEHLGIPSPSIYPHEDFSDWYHLDQQGAARNSREMVMRIRKELLDSH
jgi:hypothetical protein